MGRALPVVVSSGVDYLTATAMSKSSRRQTWALAHTLLTSEQRAGNETKSWRFSGYEGWRCGAVQVGERFDSVCVRLSSSEARDHWRELYQVADRFSRVDLQTTVFAGGPVGPIISGEYKRMLRVARAKENAAQVMLLRSSNGSSTIYSGHRSSHSFGRIYDKGRESGHPALVNSIRYEGEFKGDMCMPLLRHISTGYHASKRIRDYVSTFFRARGCAWLPASGSQKLISLPRQLSDVDRRLEWLRSQVGPSVSFLIEMGERQRMMEALGLSLVLAEPARSRKRA